MNLKPLYNPENGVMHVVGFLSGSGSNIRKLFEHQKKLDDKVYKIVALFSDNAESSAPKLGKEYNVPVIIRDINAFYQANGQKKSKLSLRPVFDQETVCALEPYGADVAAYGGYMSIASDVLINAFIGINVHPADLSIEYDGKRVYTGDKAVAKAMRAGEKHIRSSTHIMTNTVDGGPILLISLPLEVIASETPEQNQNRLKVCGDWEIFPRTMEYLGQGRFSQDDAGLLYFDGKPIPKGLKLETIF